MRFLLYMFFCTVTFLSFAAEWIVDQPSTGSYVLRNDNNKFAGARRGTVPISGDNIIVRKSFDLSKFPAGILKNAKSSQISFYTAIYEYSTTKNPNELSNGLTEKIYLRINGKNKIIPSCDSRFPVKDSVKTPLRFRWVTVTFPVEWLKCSDGKLVVEAGKLPGVTRDDYFYPAIDRSVSNSSSDLSVNGGREWTAKWGNIDENSEFMMRLEVNTEVRNDQVENCASDVSVIPMKGNWSFSGKPDTAVTLPGGEILNFTENGMTVVTVLKFTDAAVDANKKDRNMLFFHKRGAFFFGRTGNRFNFSFSSGGKGWNYAMIGGEVPSNNRWIHLATVMKKINDNAQGRVGTQVVVYLNGQQYMQKFFPYVTIDRSEEPFLIGGGIKGYDFAGEISECSVYNSAMSEAQISRMAVNSPLVDVSVPGSVKLESKIGAGFDALEEKLDTIVGRWFAAVMRRAAATGYGQEQALTLAQKLAGPGVTAERLSEKIKSEKAPLELFVSSEAILLTVKGTGRVNSPVLGFFDRRSGRDIFADRTVEWLLKYCDGRGKSYEINSFDSNQSYTVKRVATDKMQIIWDGENFKIRSQLSFVGGRLGMDFKAEPKSSNYMVTEVTFPRWKFGQLGGKCDTLVYPHMSGILVNDPTKDFAQGNVYPSSRVNMQFSGYFDSQENGIYFAMEDPLAHVKEYSVTGRNGLLSVLWRHPIAMEKGGGGNSAEISGEAVIELYRGNWFEAGALYKKFLGGKAKWWISEIPRISTPKWYRDQTLWLLVSAGHQSADELLKLTEYFELPVGAHWSHWFGFEDSQSPRYTVSQSNLDAMRRLQAVNIPVKAYVNDRLWEYCPNRPSDWKNSPGKTLAVKKADGTVDCEMYGGSDYVVLCPAEKESRDWLVREAVRVTKMGHNALYHDQVPCASPKMCFDPAHGHRPNDPAGWVEKGYWELFKELRGATSKVNPEVAHDGEEASDPYLQALDGYMVWRWTDQNHVPLFQSIYAPRAQFTGRMYDFVGPGSYESFFVKAAEQLVFGEQLGWIHINNMRYASPRRRFLKKLMHVRYNLADRFNRSDMLAPLKFKGSVPMLTTLWANLGGTHMVTTPKVLSSAWCDSKDGSVMMLFVNTVEEKLTIAPVWSGKATSGTLFTMQKNLPETVPLKTNQSFPLNFAPLEIKLLLIPVGKEETTKLTELFRRLNTFNDDGPLLMHKQNYSKVNHIKVEKGKSIRPVDSSWLKRAFIPRWTCLGFDADRWIQALVGAEVFYGEAYFGKGGYQEISIDLAADSESAGGTVEILTDDKVIASFKVPITGKWLEFKNFKQPLASDIQGKKKLFLRVKDKGCRIKNIRIF